MKPHRAIVLDEVPEVANVIAKMIQATGHPALAVYHSQAVAALAASLIPTIAFIDIQMDSGSGLQVALELKRRFRDLIVVGLTTGLRTDAIARANAAGLHSILSKPFLLADLNRILDVYGLLQGTSQPHSSE